MAFFFYAAVSKVFKISFPAKSQRLIFSCFILYATASLRDFLTFSTASFYAAVVVYPPLKSVVSQFEKK
jgi:hypothetical protein